MSEGSSGGAIRELLAVFGFGVDEEGLKKGENALEGFAERVRGLAEGLAAAFAVHEIKEFADETTREMIEISHAAERLGISSESVQKFQFAAKSLGMETESLINLMGRLQVTQAGLSQGSKQGAATFAALGVSTNDASGHMKAVDQLMFDIADGISKVKDPAKQAAFSVNLFGRSGREILPFLKEGRKGLEELGVDFKELGGGYTVEAIEKAKEYTKQSAKMNLALDGLKNTIGSVLLPIIGSIVTHVTHWVRGLSELARHSNIVQAALIVLTGAALYFGSGMLLAATPILLTVAALIGIALVIDDLITMFKGGKSLIGDTLDKLFGKGFTTDLVKELKEDWQAISDFIGEAWKNLKAFIDEIENAFKNDRFIKFLGGIGEKIGDHFGKNKVAEEESNYKFYKGMPGAYVTAGVGSDLTLGSGPHSTTVNVNVHGSASKEDADHIAHKVKTVLHEHTRRAKSRLQTAPVAR